MSDRDLEELLTDAVADVEPRFGLDEIRARTRRSRSRLWIPAGAALVAASVVAAAVLVGQSSQQPEDPGPVNSPSPTTKSDPDSPSPQPTPDGTTQTVAVYYVGGTPDGPRLYREFRPSVPKQETALEAGVSTLLSSHPEDPDYFNVWPGVGTGLRHAEVVGDVIRIELEPPATETHDLPEVNRRAAIEQLIYTAQAAVQERLPVQFLVNGNPSAEILGLPASEPLANGPVLETLALVSLTTPTEEMVVDKDEPFVVEGVGNSFEGNVVVTIQRNPGNEVVAQEPTIAGTYEEKLFPFEHTFDLTDVDPGSYLVSARTDDPSGQERFHTDTRRITIVD